MMTAKDFLQSIRDNSRRIRALGERRKDYYDLSLTGISLQAPHVKKGSQSSPVEVSALRIIDDIAGEIDREIAQMAQEIQFAESVIQQISDRRARDVLRYRYLNGWSWEKVSGAMCYNMRYVHKMHGQALKEFETLADLKQLSKEEGKGAG